MQLDGENALEQSNVGPYTVRGTGADHTQIVVHTISGKYPHCVTCVCDGRKVIRSPVVTPGSIMPLPPDTTAFLAVGAASSRLRNASRRPRVLQLVLQIDKATKRCRHSRPLAVCHHTSRRLRQVHEQGRPCCTS